MSFFVSHSSFLTVKRVDLAVACDGFPLKRNLSVFFILATLIVEVLFEQFLIRSSVVLVTKTKSGFS